MRNMSFRLTKKQFIDGTKDVTRRDGWLNLKAGEHFSAVEKSQGLKKGEKVNYLGQCICISNVSERVDEIIRRPLRVDQIHRLNTEWRTEPEREGFPDLTPEKFVEMFCKEMGVKPSTIIQRIVFKVIHVNGQAK